MKNIFIENFFRTNQPTLDKLTDFMLDYNAHTNLTRITEREEIRTKHYLDSILPLAHFNVPRGTSLIDIGSGAGFPGIPMKLARPDLAVTLLDSAKKRTDYLAAATREISISCVVVNARSEELSHNPDFREAYQAATARAVANLSALCEYCLPFVKIGGVFLALKGENPEIDGAKKAIKILGGEVEAVKYYELPTGDKRSLVIIRKICQTSTEFPRKRVNITKRPM